MPGLIPIIYGFLLFYQKEKRKEMIALERKIFKYIQNLINIFDLINLNSMLIPQSILQMLIVCLAS